MSCVLTYTLIQETPMIHFQYNESGAILRASDVKPRFDKFLFRQMEEEQKERLSISKEHSALDYKMKIVANGHPDISGDIAKSYFGNMGDESSNKKTVFYKDPITLKIICFHPELRQLIEDNIRGFFLLNNFGTRQDKGFGSFRVQGKSVSAEVLFQKYAAAEKCTVYKINDSFCNHRGEKTGHLENADIFYKLLKSGINASKMDWKTGKKVQIYYEKSLLTKYMLKKQIGGEKRWMKKQGIAPTIGKSSGCDRDYENITDYKYIRAVLGIGDHQKWFIEEGSNKKVTINISPGEGNRIERFQSPLTFTVYNDRLYLIAYEPDRIIYDKEFTFSGYKDKAGSCTTLSAEDFKMKDFMHYVQENIKGLHIHYFGGRFYKFSMTEVTK